MCILIFYDPYGKSNILRLTAKGQIAILFAVTVPTRRALQASINETETRTGMSNYLRLTAKGQIAILFAVTVPARRPLQASLNETNDKK